MSLEIADESATTLPRRAVVKAAAVGGLAAVMAGCETYGVASTDQDDGSAEPSGQSGDPTGGTAGTALASTSEIPVGGGKVFDGQNVVVTQPEGGQFVAFSAVCTHQGCTVASVLDGTINCPCHGSKFSVKDGSVEAGPAPKPLSKVQISVDGTSITLA